MSFRAAAVAAAVKAQRSGVAAAAICSRSCAEAAPPRTAADKSVTRELKTVQVLPRALGFHSAGPSATAVTSGVAGVCAGDLECNTSRSSGTTLSIGGSIITCAESSGGSTVEALRTACSCPWRTPGRTRRWSHLSAHGGKWRSHRASSSTLTELAYSAPRWISASARLRSGVVSVSKLPSSPSSLSACTDLSLCGTSHARLRRNRPDVPLTFSASFSFFSGGRPLSPLPLSVPASSPPCQTARRRQFLYTRSPSSGFYRLFNACSSLICSFSLTTSPSLCSQHSPYSSSLAGASSCPWAASSTRKFVASYASSAPRRYFSTSSSSRTSAAREPCSVLHPTHLWPCAQQLHTSLLLSVLQRGEIAAPTDVQERSVSSLLAGESSLIIAPTGSGKTLAWALPLLSNLLHADRERLAPYAQQPRLLVLVPSRELAQQLLYELRKHFSSAGISVAAAAAGQSYVKEVRALMGGGPGGGAGTTGADVLITTPARLLLHLHKRNVNLRRVKAVVVEEADTLCDTFYEQELLFILSTLHQAVGGSAAATIHAAAAVGGCTAVTGERGGELQSHCQRRLESLDSRARRAFPAVVAGLQRQQPSSCATSVAAGLPRGPTAVAERPPVQLVFVAATKTGALGRFLRKQLEGMPMTFICAPDAHLTNPGVQQVFVPLAGEDRLGRLLEVLDEKAAGAGAPGAGGGTAADAKKTIIFCNTVNSCRAVDLTLVEKGYRVSCLHGMMPFKLRKTSLLVLTAEAPSHAYATKLASDCPHSCFRRFKEGQTDILVCTNVASRGLDISGVEHVIMFDFPQTLADYLHRSGRTARGGETGRVTLLFSKRNLPLIQQIQSISKATLSPPELRYSRTAISAML